MVLGETAKEQFMCGAGWSLCTSFLSWIPYLCGSTMKQVRPLKARYDTKGVEIPEYMTQMGYKGKTGVFTAAEVEAGALVEFMAWSQTPEAAAAFQAAAAAQNSGQTF